jgi:hypothetical protein
MRIAALLLTFSSLLTAGGRVLIVADEFPAMEVLAAKLKATEGLESTLVEQTKIPSDLDQYSALVVYIHRSIGEPAEQRFVQYAEKGGRLVLLHHTISSRKRENKSWLPFMRVELPNTDFEKGGYKWIEPVRLELVNLAPKEYITNHHVPYESKIRYTSSNPGAVEKDYHAFTLEDTEVYLNHSLSGPRTILLGLKYKDPSTGTTYMQDTAGWYMRTGKGAVVYLMAGHSARDFEHPAYGQIVVNAVAARLP